MPTGRKATTVVWISAAVLLVGTVLGTVAVALIRANSQQAVAASSTLAAVTPTPVEATTPPAALTVPPLRRLTPPDAVVILSHAAGIGATGRLSAMTGVRTVAVVSRGVVRVGGTRLHVLGVPLSTVRGFTPSLTASSTPLWQSIARGELTVAYAHSRRLRHRLGATLAARGARGRTGRLRIGAFATIGLPGAQALLSASAGATLGFAPAREVLISAPKLSVTTLRDDVRTALGPKATVEITRVAPVNQSLSSSYALSTIPPTYLALYRRAAVTCPGLPWTVLAAVGTVETGNGRDVHRSVAGAEGPMQFLPSTWAVWGYDADGDGKANIHDPVDAVFSAARYLCAAGAGRGGQSLDDAIYAYNHAWWYVREVVLIANQYA